MSNENLKIILNDGNDNTKRFLMENTAVTNAEYLPRKRMEKQKDNSIVYKKSSVIEKRIQFFILAHVQQNTNAVDRVEIENRAMKNINKDLIALKLVEPDGKLMIPKSFYKIAIAEEVRKLIKKEIDNKFLFTRRELQHIAKVNSRNITHLNNVLKDMAGKDTHTVTETYISDDYSEIRERKLNVQMFPVTGNDISLTNIDEDEKLIVKIEEDLMPYLIAPHKGTVNRGYNLLQGEIFEAFESEYAQILYKILVDIKDSPQNKVFTYKELQLLFGTNYGVVKALDEKGVPRKNQNQEFIYELDEYKNRIYMENYKTTWKSFKQFVLTKAIAEINSDKTPYIIEMHEIRDSLRKPITGIMFIIKNKKTDTFLNFERYNSLSYYCSVAAQFEKSKMNQGLINDLDKYAEVLVQPINAGGIYTPLFAGTSCIEELKELVSHNVVAIKAIKEILSLNIPNLNHLKFNETYMVVVDGRTVRKSSLRLQTRLGDNAIDSYKNLINTYSKTIEKHRDNAEDEFSNFLPFKYFSKKSGKLISVTKKNIDEHLSEIKDSIRTGDKRAFKGFLSRMFKNDFYTRFFGLFSEQI